MLCASGASGSCSSHLSNKTPEGVRDLVACTSLRPPHQLNYITWNVMTAL